MSYSASKYFWILDNNIPKENINDYKLALKEKKSTQLNKIVRLISNKVPIVPMAYVTNEILKYDPNRLPEDYCAELGEVLNHLEEESHCKLADPHDPLLVTLQGTLAGAVRFLGCSLQNLSGLIEHLGKARAFIMYVSYLESYSSIVMGAAYTDFRKTFKIKYDREKWIVGLGDLEENQFRRFVMEYQTIIENKTGKTFPKSAEKQFLNAIPVMAHAEHKAGGKEIFIKTDILSTLSANSTYGVVYTRNPFNGNQDLYGIYHNKNGDKKPLEISSAHKGNSRKENLRDSFPQIYADIKEAISKIEAIYCGVTEAEFITEENGKLYFYSFEKAQTTTKASMISAVDLNTCGHITDAEAVLKFKPEDLEVMLHPTLSESSRPKLTDLGSVGITASPGTAIGRVFFCADEALKFYQNAKREKKDDRIILIVYELLISDTSVINIIDGLLTRASGIASHAAVMARANNIPCIVGYEGLTIDKSCKFMTVNGKKVEAGTMITLEAGNKGYLYIGEGELENPSAQENYINEMSKIVSRVMKEKNIPLRVKINANNVKDIKAGLSFGADGVGLFRTENMFTNPESIKELRNIIFTQDPNQSKSCFSKLEEMQFEDFKEIFSVLDGKPINIRLMDIALHELIPEDKDEFDELVKQLKHLTKQHIIMVAESLKEINPMLGLRACRFGVNTPQIYEMQVRAITRAAYYIKKKNQKVNPGIMFPLVFSKGELEYMQKRVVNIQEVLREEEKIPYDDNITFRIGTMIELPAAVLEADKLAKICDFFAFGTNDLTQTTMGISRDDSSKYLTCYLEKGIIKHDPFKVLSDPVKELIEIAIRRGRQVRHNANFGICGEQGGNLENIQFLLDNGLDYVSCSPYRVLPARLALIHKASNT